MERRGHRPWSATSTARGRRPSVRRHQWLTSVRSAARSTRGRFGLAMVSVVVLLAVIGPFVEPYGVDRFVTTPFAGPSASHFLGGDDLGRDVLSRILGGGWVLLLMALGATAFGIVLGGAAGISAAYLRGRRDGLIMRTVDVMLAFPQLVFALLLVSVVGPKLWLIVIAVGISHAPQVARVFRAATLDVSERDYIKAAELTGASSVSVMFEEILPSLVTPLMVEAGLRLTYSIVIMAGLSFLGFGQPPPAPNWGLMINENRIGLELNPWATIAPITVIAFLSVGVNTFTDAIARVVIGVDRSVGLLTASPEPVAFMDQEPVEAIP